MNAHLKFALWSSLATLASCGGSDGGGSPTPPVVDNSPSTIVVSPPGTTSLTSGATATFSATVAAKDGHVVSAAVSWSSSDASVASVVAGVVTAAKVGTASITASAGSATSSVAVSVTPGAASQLAVRTQPVGAVIGNVLATQPVIEVRDAAGNVVTTSTASVTAAIATGGGTLGGTASVSAVAGVATFSGLSVSGTAGDRTLTFTSAGLSAATSAAFTMQPPPTPLIVIDSTKVTIQTQHGANPAAVVLHITNGGSAPLAGLAVGTLTYDAGQPTGWLTATLSGSAAPATLTIAPASGTLANGTYHAVVPITGTGAPNSPLNVGVTFVVSAGTFVNYGTSAEKVRVVDVSNTFTPATSFTDSSGLTLPALPVTYSSRATSIVTVGSDGKLTARAAGEAWVVATITSGSTDSVYVIVPRSTTAPIIRTTSTTWAARAGDTTFVTVVLDTRGTTVGAGAFAIGIQTTPLVWNSILFFAAPGPPTPIVTNSTGDLLRVAVGSATGMTGQVALVTLKLLGRTAGLSGWLTLTAVDVAALDGSDLTASVTSTRFPISIR